MVSNLSGDKYNYSYTTEDPIRIEGDNFEPPTFKYDHVRWNKIELTNVLKITPGILNSQMFLPEVLRDKIDVGYSEITGKVLRMLTIHLNSKEKYVQRLV